MLLPHRGGVETALILVVLLLQLIDAVLPVLNLKTIGFELTFELHPWRHGLKVCIVAGAGTAIGGMP